ncbi:radical SAM protein [Chitinophaga nivalis]|uniref:Radical SAM protein n=1 Tax=Chitinophaga nivalis TaxID=2991709 RepID=A0ABT3INQ6_9BACT|nr:radical SAM protein [Chitinophaga nivalis]MCW3464959.1 radical SAM protein [Chitinophaga nivalis]MCW3485349.1 radical SAM protein [Chitinophaga nivalis]
MTYPQLTAFPRALYIELTDRCNLNCPMCRSAGFKGDVLPFDMYEDIARVLFPHARFIDLRGWGESTILKNFEDYLDVALQYGKRIKLISNGTINRPSLWEKLGRERVLVGISFDAADEVTFERIRGGASMKKVLHNIELLQNALLSNNHSVSDNLYFCITVSGDNAAQLCDIIKLGMQFGITHFKMEPLKTTAEDPSNLIHHTARVKQAIQDLKHLVMAYPQLKVEYSASLLEEETNVSKVKKFCIHPFTYLYINSKGGLGFCDHLNGVAEFVWGQWKGVDGFSAFWHGEKMKLLREEHQQALSGGHISSCVDCNWCYERRYADLEYLIEDNWANYSEIVTQ